MISKQNLSLLLLVLLPLVPSCSDAACRSRSRGWPPSWYPTYQSYPSFEEEPMSDDAEVEDVGAKDYRQLGDDEAISLLASRVPEYCGRAPKSSFTPYIAGGYEAKAGDYPSYVRIDIFSGKRSYSCGGTLISDRHVITAAHCLVKAKKINLVFTIKRKDYQAIRRIARENQFCISANYKHKTNTNPAMLHHDLGLITIEPVKFNELIQPACIPLQPIETKKQLMAVGLGVKDQSVEDDSPAKWPKVLQVLPVKVEQCDSDDQHDTKVCFIHSDPRYVGDTCGGDSGGPIYGYEFGMMTVVAATSYGPSLCKANSAGKSVNTDLFKTLADLGRLMAQCGGAMADVVVSQPDSPGKSFEKLRKPLNSIPPSYFKLLKPWPFPIEPFPKFTHWLEDFRR